MKEGDLEKLAAEALAFHMVCFKGCFKCAMGYFFTNSLDSNV